MSFEQWEPPMCGRLRISNPKTLQSWIDKGLYQEQLDRGLVYNVGCYRFTKGPCTCSDCRKRTGPDSRVELRKVLERIKK